MGVDRFAVESDGCKLAARSYAPATNRHPGGGVVLVHGLLAAADFFDAPGLESMSLPRALQQAGVHAVTYDQRGTGDSTARDWSFSIREHSSVDLPAVMAACRSRFGFDRVVLVSHSLGGTIWLRYVRARLEGTIAGAKQPDIVAGAVVASPAVLNDRNVPWSDIATRGAEWLADIDRNKDRVVTREEFVRAQITLYWPRRAFLFSPGVLQWLLRRGSQSTAAAWMLKNSRTPAIIYHRDDFDAPTFRQVLASKAIDRGPHRLLVDLIGEITGPQPPTPPKLPFDGLAISSYLDGFVPLPAVQAFADQFQNGRFIVTEKAYGIATGHTGYMFKAGLHEQVTAEVVAFVKEKL